MSSLTMTNRPLTALTITIGLVLALSACTSDPTPDTGRLAPSFGALAQQFLDRNGDELSEWDRAVVEKAVETGRISQAD